MKRYHVITRTIETGEHLNFEDLLPASCSHITGVFVTANGKMDVGLTTHEGSLSFPQTVINSLMKRHLEDLFYSYLRTRSTKEISQAYFENEMLLKFSDVLSRVRFDGLSIEDNDAIQENITDAIVGSNGFQGLSSYLYDSKCIYDSTLQQYDFISYVLKLTVQYLYSLKANIFKYTIQHYVQPKDVEVGNATLLVNGIVFLLRDDIVVANRKLRPISKEVSSFNEPLFVNSSLKVVFKNTTKNIEIINGLTIKIYVQYEF